MCVPLIVGAVMAVGSLAAGASSAGAHEFNAAQNTQQAALEQEKAAWDIARVRDNTKRVLGAQRAGYSAQGIDISQGTPTDIAFDTLTESEKDIYSIQWGANVRSANYQNAAELDRYNASSARTASYFNAFGAVAGGFDKQFGGTGKVPGLGEGLTRMGATIFDTPGGRVNSNIRGPR